MDSWLEKGRLLTLTEVFKKHHRKVHECVNSGACLEIRSLRCHHEMLEGFFYNRTEDNCVRFSVPCHSKR